MHAPEVEDTDMDPFGGQRIRPTPFSRRLDGDQLFIVGALLLVFSACASSIASVSTVAAGAGVIALVPATLAGRSNLISRAVIGLGLFWLAYGFAVGSLPSLNRPDELVDFAETEGRAFLILGIIAATQGIRSTGTFDAMTRWLVWIVTATSAIGLVLDRVGLIDGTRGNVYAGLTSSHHVVGFLAGLAIVVVLVRPGIIGVRWLRWVSFGVLAISLALSGSRASALAVAACAGAVWICRRGLRSILIPLLAALVLGGLATAASTRAQNTAEIFVSTDFWADARTAWNDGTTDGARALADNEAQGNLLIRFALWGSETNQFLDSPIIGYGRFRTNDVELSYSGVEGLVYVATSGERRFNDGQPHNQLLFILAETGIVGLGLTVAPFIVAWRRVRRAGDFEHEGEAIEGDSVGGGDAETADPAMLFGVGVLALFVVGLSSAGLLTTGFGVASALVIFGAARSSELLSGDDRAESSGNPQVSTESQ